MSTLIIILLIALFLLLLGGMLSLFIPGKWEIEEQILASALPEKIFPLLNIPENWRKWSIWSKEFDESIVLEYSEEREGLGAIQSWTSEQMNGILTIVQSNEEQNIQFHLALGDNEHIFHAQIRLAPINLETAVIWTTKFDLESYNPIKRLQSLPLKKLMLYNMQASLERLETVVVDEV